MSAEESVPSPAGSVIVTRSDFACADAGATHASYIILRLPWEVAPLFKNWLSAHFPDRAERVMNRVRDMRGGKDYDSDFSKRMKGEGIWADLLRQRFRQAVKRLGLNERTNGILDLSQFRGAPAGVAPVQRLVAGTTGAKVRDDAQLSLF